jgi:TetR/AcrR family transcriptional regulator, regulator of mycofactocin system
MHVASDHLPPSGETTAAGRPPATSLAELEHAALGLFATRGFEETTVEQIAAAVGIGRRTFFRYFRSKNDVAWGDFDGHLAHLRDRLEAVAPTTPIGEALRECILEFNRFPDSELPWHRQRMTLLLKVPALQAHSTLRYRAWREVVADFVARRRGEAADALVPQVVAHTALGAAIAAYERWLADGQASLPEVMDAALRVWLDGLRVDPPGR